MQDAKLRAEIAKLKAETKKLETETRWYPVVVTVSLVVAVVGLTKLFL